MSTLSPYFEYLQKEFGDPRDAVALSEAEIADLRGALPESLIDFWRLKGAGVWSDGLFQFRHPRFYSDAVRSVFRDDPEFRPDDVSVYGHTAFGKLFAWSEHHHEIRIDLIWRTVTTQPFEAERDEEVDIGVALTSLLGGIGDLDDIRGRPMFKRTCNRVGGLGRGEIYGFRGYEDVPACLDVERVARMDAERHIADLARRAAFNLVDYSTLPSRIIRELG